MNKEQALQVLQSFQNVAIQKGLFADVKAVNQVSLAIATLQAALLEKAND